ncbi:MAG: ISNCY family transposase [Bdellovibrionales bacterium]|nr:ISNCY family transposase [Bdellovibrionales bacterium]
MELVLKHSESIRFQVVSEFIAGKLFRFEAAELLSCSERTITRWATKIKYKGLQGVKNGNYGRVPRNKIPDSVRKQVLELIRKKYYDFNVTHLLETLEEKHGIMVSYSTLHRWCKAANMVKNPRRGKSKVRKPRPRMRREGYILQMDGSHHRFNGEDEWCLISAIDDATSKIIHAEFFSGETTKNCLQFLMDLIRKKGVPMAIYTDRAGWSGFGKRDNFLHFVAACEKLGIKVLFAGSPEAKGRVERSFRTIQDRLIPELRINKIKTMKEANFYLQKVFIPQYWNKKNTVEAQDPNPAYSKLPKEIDLKEICCFEYRRKIAKDQTISWRSKKWPVNSKLIKDLRGYNATIRVLLNGEVRIFVMGNKIEAEGITRPIKQQEEPVVDTEFNKMMRVFYFKYVNKIYCEVRNHMITGKPLNLEKIILENTG